MTNFKETKISITVRPQSIKRDRGDHPVYLQVSLKDNGQGILKNTGTHIFESFYRLNRYHIHQGSRESGLDLAIAEATVKNNQKQLTKPSILKIKNNSLL